MTEGRWHDIERADAVERGFSSRRMLMDALYLSSRDHHIRSATCLIEFVLRFFFFFSASPLFRK